jgi:DNA recombination protein Rad52
MSFTAEQTAALAAKLDSSRVKQREQGGRKFSYVEGWHAIAEANRIFGYDAWDRETIEVKCVSERERKVGKGQYERDGFGVAYIAKVRVTVRADGAAIVREGTGYGSGIDADLGSAHESAIKEAETDAMKRALMTFGNPFGLALYDKEQENVEHAKPAPAPQRASAPSPTPKAAPAPAQKPVPSSHSAPLKFELLDAKEALAGAFATPDEWCRALRKSLIAPGAQVTAIWESNKGVLQSISDHHPELRWTIGGKMVHPADDLRKIFEQLAPGVAA